MSLSTQRILAAGRSIISNYTLYWALNGDYNLQFVVKQNDTDAMWTACVDKPLVFTTKNIEVGMDTMCDMLVSHMNGSKDEITDINFCTFYGEPVGSLNMVINVQFKLGIVHRGNRLIALKRYEEPSVKEPSALAVNKDDMLQITVTQSGKTWRAAVSCDKIEKVVDNGVSVSNELALFKKDVDARMDRLESMISKLVSPSNMPESFILIQKILAFVADELVVTPFGDGHMNMSGVIEMFNTWLKKNYHIDIGLSWETFVNILKEEHFKVVCVLPDQFIGKTVVMYALHGFAKKSK